MAGNRGKDRGQSPLPSNMLQVADVKQLLSAKDAKDANTSEASFQSDNRIVAPATQDAPAFFASDAGKKNGSGVRNSSMRD
ncbi:MAG: hypothetical protein JNL89_13020 [Rhodanobacteraceae bacterium]|nr:hypothetical protein [Rhodanobacteraceae bacterium]